MGGLGCPPLLTGRRGRPAKRCILGALARWTVHGPAMITARVLYTGTRELAVGLYADECELTDAGVAWMLLGS